MRFILLAMLLVASGSNYALDELQDMRSPTAIEPEEVIRSDDQVTHKLGERSKALGAILMRANRRKINVKGYVEVELMITPLGRVSEVKQVSTTITHEETLNKLIRRVKLINFGRDLSGKAWVGCYTFTNDSEFKISYGCKANL